MANRAFLFFSDSEEPRRFISDDETRYCDSRWNIPIAWWFLFSPESLVRMRREFKGAEWEEPYLVETWDNAKSNFRSRMPLLKKIIGGKLPEDKLSEFIGTLDSHSKSYLMMDPNEVMEEEETDFERSASILKALDEDTVTYEEKFSIIDSYTGLASLKDIEKMELYILGCAYG